MTRTLTIRFQDSFTTTVVIPGFISFNELESAREFVGLIIKYKLGFQRFISRSPKITMGSRVKLYTDLGDVFNTIVNARKFLDMAESKDDIFGSASQHFNIDFITGTFTLYKNETKEERGTMSLGLVYSNWEELFYPDLVTPSFSIDAIMEHSVEESVTIIPSPDVLDRHPNTDKMLGRLDPIAFELWNEVVNVCKIDCQVEISYSGSGDSGQIDSIYLADKEKISTEELDKLGGLAWDVIDREEGGFYNNDGGYGEITIKPGSFEWNHYNYYTETNQSVQKFIKLEEDEHALILEEAAKEAEEESDYEYDEDGFEVDEEEEDDHWDEIAADDKRHFKDDE